MRFGASEFRIVVYKRKEWMRGETFDVCDPRATLGARSLEREKGNVGGELFARIRFANTNMSERYKPVLFGRGERI